MSYSYHPVAEERPDRYRVRVDEYRSYQTNGFLVAPGLVSPEDTSALLGHAVDLLEGRADLPGLEKLHSDAKEEDRLRRFSRVHMLHRIDGMAERYLRHPRILDVLEALIGPDVLCLQTMLFFNPPGTGGQGWHQDSFYITTYPDTLIGAWLALDAADEENGCLYVAPGSHREPIYPDQERGNLIHADGAFADLQVVGGASSLNDAGNDLTPVAARYGEPVPVRVQPGDVIFFHPHLLHRSFPNGSQNRWRRAFVSHYCNARSWVPWNHGDAFEGEAANYLHLLGRGQTHLPHAQPRFAEELSGT